MREYSIEKCFDCGEEKQIFTRAYRKNNFQSVCESCAEKQPSFYYIYQDSGGTYSYWEGNKQEAEKHLSRILEQYGKQGLSYKEVFLVPGKYRYESDFSKRKYGRRIYVSSNIKGEISID